MGLNDLQSHFTQNIGNTVESVDLLKLAHQQSNASKGGGPTVTTTKGRGAENRLKLLVDAECCLDRLYGGYFPDWICGGQWNKMEQFLRNFATVVQSSNLDLVMCFNGGLELDRLEGEWKAKQEETVKFIEEINRHVSSKRKPPPKIWWVPPTYLRSAVRTTFRSLQMRTISTLEDHHKEIVRFCQKNNFHGVVADDPEYLVFDTPRYFSAQKLKLTFKGSLETVELNLKKVYEDLKLPKEKFHIFAALFGNHLLTDSDLANFYSALNVDPTSKTSMIEKVAEFTRNLDSTDIDKITEQIKTLISSTSDDTEAVQKIMEKVTKCLRYYSDLTIPKPKDKNSKSIKAPTKKDEPKEKEIEQQKIDEIPDTANEEKAENDVRTNGGENIENGGALPSDSQNLEDDSKIFTETESEVTPVVNGTSNNTSITENGDANGKTSLTQLLYRVNLEIENVCITRHKNGLMSLYIYQILKHKEIKLPVIVEDYKDLKDMPRAHELYRPLRQRVYAILFNLHHLHFLANQREEEPPSIFVKEIYFCPQSKTIKTDTVQGVEVGWAVPTVEKLWLGDKEDCKRKRTRAFLTIMRSDKPIMLDNNFVPQQMLVLAVVLRYILSSERKILRKSELEAFLAQAFIQEMTDPSIAQDIEVSNLTMRGVHLAHLFMEGVEMAVLANDACGAPIPYMLQSPWMFFNGKVFNYVLEQQSLGKSLAEICGYKMDLVFSVDQLRLAITDGVKVQYAQAPNLIPLLGSFNPLIASAPNHRVPLLPNHLSQQTGPPNLSHLAAAASSGVQRNRFVNPSLFSQTPLALASGVGGAGQGMMGAGHLYNSYGGTGLQVNRGVPIYNDIPGKQRRGTGAIGGRGHSGGQLEVAGMVVGSWGANYGTSLGYNNYNSLLGSAGRNVRMAGGPGTAYGQSIPFNSLFDQMRISGGGKQQNYRQSSYNNTNWQQRKNLPGKNQRKPAPNSKKETNNKPGNNVVGDSTSNMSTKDDKERLDIGSGDASEGTDKEGSINNGPSKSNESSPTHVEVEVNHNLEG